METPNATSLRGSLLDDIVQEPPKPPAAARRLVRSLKAPAFIVTRWNRGRTWWSGQMKDPAKRRKTLRTVYAASAVAAAGLAIGAYFWLRPVPQPDYLADPLNDVFNYTLLTDEFNKLPVEERLKLIGQLVQRLKGMSGNDSLLMASFAAGIAGAARQQIEENGARLAVDTWDKYAKDYSKVGDDERDEYLDKTFVEFAKMMEAVGGQPRDVSDEQRLEEVKRQANRDREALRKDPSRGPSSRDLGRVFTFMDRNIGGHANAEQRQRGMLMMRDMVRHFRGQDVSTGKPKGGG